MVGHIITRHESTREIKSVSARGAEAAGDTRHHENDNRLKVWEVRTSAEYSVNAHGRVATDAFRKSPREDHIHREQNGPFIRSHGEKDVWMWR